ncbi:unnamed protein product [Clavelina lepadiformis]|uniref:JmjC domain-containing protein n=1 Tax=Clavelina lepadiformis TaxID=159417 RepID=A0ABP0FR62_CLALP
MPCTSDKKEISDPAEAVKVGLRSCLTKCSRDAREFYIGSNVERCDVTPTPLKFYRDYVAKNIPCVFENSLNHWPALKKWNNSYLKKTIGSKEVTVAVTPNGYADAINKERFVLPEERLMTLNEFFEKTENNECENEVFYIQKQNSNLTEEFQDLMVDVEKDIPWANEAFNKKPDAVNFWMGQSRAISSLHKDPYENLYCVIQGEKTFTLYPPCDRPFLPYKTYPIGRYKYSDGQWTIKSMPGESVPWIAVDPLNPDFKNYPQFENARPLICRVRAGEMLYLPSLWFHHVQQTDLTIAVNYWYDMEFDIKYGYYQTLDKLTEFLESTSVAD